MKLRILVKINQATLNGEWIATNTIMGLTGLKKETLWKSLKRLFDEGLVQRQRIQPAKGRWYYVYQLKEAGHTRLMQGGLPTGSEMTEKRVLEAVVTSLQQILDTGRLKFESRQVMTAFDPFVTKVLRDACDPLKRTRKGKKSDRATQRVYACHAFTISIPHTGNSQVTLKDWMGWDKAMAEWMQKAGLSMASAEDEIQKLWRQVPGGTTRAEIPVLEQAMRRLKVKATCDTTVKREGEIIAEVSSNINYSLNDIGIEYFGTTRWVDAIIRTLIALQHTTMVSEVSRDQWISDMLESVEKLRKEREQKAKEKEDEKDRRWKDGLV